MPTTALMTDGPGGVKSEIVDQFSSALDDLFTAAASGSTPRSLEKELWVRLLEVARCVMAVLFALVAVRETDSDLAQRGLTLDDVKLRMDRSYWTTLMTTFGAVCFPLFAYREERPEGGTVTRTPARLGVFRLHKHCKSSELCLEWETRLGSTTPFRQAQQLLTYFTHDAAALEDNTIARHMVIVGSLVSREWQYRSPEEIRKILQERATRETGSDRPIVYISTDAHALRRYVDDTWNAKWKMANGIRLWCVDRKTDRIIHLGGEYIWGDCYAVKAVFEELIAAGYLPADGRYDDEVHARVVFLSDGLPWMVTHLVPLFDDAITILDAYHLLERLASHAAEFYGKGKKRAKNWYKRAALFLFPDFGKSKKKPAKKRRGPRPPKPKDISPERPPAPATDGPENLIWHLIEMTVPKGKKMMKLHLGLLNFIGDNLFRIDYPSYRHLGYQIGSGAMESLHRVGSQMRLKLAGARWLRETTESIFALRMMNLVGKWDEFWAQSTLREQLPDAFAQASRQTQETG